MYAEVLKRQKMATVQRNISLLCHQPNVPDVEIYTAKLVQNKSIASSSGIVSFVKGFCLCLRRENECNYKIFQVI